MTRKITVMRGQCVNTAAALITLIAEVLLAGSPGMRPRANAADYPAHQTVAEFTLGAVVIPRSDVKKIFATDLNGGGYIVIEAGVFPARGKEVDLSPGDFMLLTDGGKVVTRPVDPDAVATAIARQHSPSKPSGIYTSAGVEVSHGSGVDPASGRRIEGTAVGVGVGVGNGTSPYPVPQPGTNISAMEQELWAKSLPDGKTTVPVSGYLYFPKPSGKKDSVWDLMMDGPAGRIKLALPDH
jgi:hypothetical protein